MTAKKPIVMYSGQLAQLQAGDTLDASANEVEVFSATNEEASIPITIGMPVYVSSTAKVKMARADAAATARVIALCLTASVAAVSGVGSFQTTGQITLADWTTITGSATLTAGTVYYLSEAAYGALISSAPATGWVTKVGVALSTTMMDLQPEQPIRI